MPGSSGGWDREVPALPYQPIPPRPPVHAILGLALNANNGPVPSPATGKNYDCVYVWQIGCSSCVFYDDNGEVLGYTAICPEPV